MASLSNTTEKPVLVALTPEEARLFVEFQKHRDLFEILVEKEVFTIKGGYVTIHFTNKGAVGSLEVHRRYGIISP